MREMKNSGLTWIGEIPTGWNIQRGKNILTLLERPIKDDDGVITCFRDGEVTLRSKRREEGFTFSLQEIGYQGIEPGDLVVHGMDGFAGAIGISDSRGKATPVLNVMDSTQSKRYLMYQLRTMAHCGLFFALSSGIRVRSCDTNWNKLRVISYVVPSLLEQQRIADFLDVKCAEIDSILDATRTSVEEYKKLKQSVITETVTKGICGNRPMKETGVEWIGEIPAEWDVIKIKWLLKERNDRSENGSEEPLSMSQKYGIIPTNELDTVPNMASSFVGAKLVSKGDLVFNKLKAHLGVFAVSEFDGLVSPDYAVYYSAGRCDVKYLERIFKTPQYISEFRKRSTGVGAGLTRLYTSDLFDMYTALPSETEQKEISAYLDDKCATIDSLIASKEALITELEAYKKSLIYEYVSGKKEVI